MTRSNRISSGGKSKKNTDHYALRFLLARVLNADRVLFPAPLFLCVDGRAGGEIFYTGCDASVSSDPRVAFVGAPTSMAGVSAAAATTGVVAADAVSLSTAAVCNKH